MPEFRMPDHWHLSALDTEEFAKAVANSDPLVDPVTVVGENGVLCVAIPAATYHDLVKRAYPPKAVKAVPEPHVRRTT